MRKIRKAAAVAAMVAGLGTVGAGTAFAGGHPMPPVFNQTNNAACEVSATQNTNALLSDVNVLSGIAVGLLGDAEATASNDDSLAPSCTQELENEVD